MSHMILTAAKSDTPQLMVFSRVSAFCSG